MKRICKYINKDNGILSNNEEFIRNFRKEYKSCERQLCITAIGVFIASLLLGISTKTSYQQIMLMAILAICLGVFCNIPLYWVSLQKVILDYVKTLSHEKQIEFCEAFKIPIRTTSYTHEQYYDVYMYAVPVKLK